MRDAILAEIDLITPFDATEATQIAQARAWIASGVEIFRRVKPATPPMHLVSYFLLVDGDHVLLVDHIGAQLWLPSGGHVDPGEHPRETVRREVIEELGIAAEFASDAPVFLTITETAGLYPGHVDVSLWYLLLGDRDRALDFDRGEFLGIRWFARDAVPLARSDPNMGRFLAKLASLGRG